jgi:outer membrane immunogenic protein
MIMRTLVLTTALALIWGSTCEAADLPARMYTKAAPMAATYNWTGYYAGLHLGLANGNIKATDFTSPSGGFFTDLVPAGTEAFQFRNANIAGGVHAGAQYQWQKFVLGAEASWTGTGIRQTITSPYFPASDTETGKIENLVTAVGRIGYVYGRTMVYAKGGYAGGEVGFKARDNVALVTYEQKLWQNGYVVGGGFDYALNNQMIVGVDYSHIDLGSTTTTGNNVFDSGALGANPETFQTEADVDMVTAHLSYKFGGSESVYR